MKFGGICSRGAAVAICSINGPMFAVIWLCHSFGFSLKEASGWVRVVRQGAIYGAQQDFVIRMDRAFHPQITVVDRTSVLIHRRTTGELGRVRHLVMTMKAPTTSHRGGAVAHEI
jgi:hypothetical protein